MPFAIWERRPVSYLRLFGSFVSGAEPLFLRVSGKTQFLMELDGALLGDGPSRFASVRPQYTTYPLTLLKGEHKLSIRFQYLDFPTRLSDDVLPPFFFWQLVNGEGEEVPLPLSYTVLSGYDLNPARRMAPTLGLIEWGMKPVTESAPLPVPLAEGFPMEEDPTRPVRHLKETLAPTRQGTLTEEFGYERDCDAARFLLRELDGTEAPAQGIYRRYDLGQIRLGRPLFTLDLPAGAEVEIALSERLASGRVSPFISLTEGLSANIVHYRAKGGVETFFPLTPLGGRYMELHVLCPEPESVRVLSEHFVWRTFFEKEPAFFHSGRERLDDAWQMSVDTLRSCTEDVVTDCPVRERGQWTGDSSAVGLRTAAAAYGDMQVIRKSLAQAKDLADKNGVIPALFPGQSCYFISYSLLWVCGLYDYYQSCGDLTLLQGAYPQAERFLGYLKRCQKEDGSFVEDGKRLPSGFIDWGYAPPEYGPEFALSCLALSGMEAFEGILRALSLPDGEWKKSAAALRETLKRESGMRTLSEIGYHGVVLLLKGGIFPAARQGEAIAYIKDFMQASFPNKKDAPRLSHPSLHLKQVITPYFAHFALWALFENGEAEFAYSQIEACWGYMRERGETTCIEVFDHRWSHCHQWSGCPAWLLSAYALGLHKRYDLGDRHLELKLRPGDMAGAEGALPLPCGSLVQVNWERKDGITLTVTPETDVWIHWRDETVYCEKGRDTRFVL